MTKAVIERAADGTPVIRALPFYATLETPAGRFRLRYTAEGFEIVGDRNELVASYPPVDRRAQLREAAEVVFRGLCVDTRDFRLEKFHAAMASLAEALGYPVPDIVDQHQKQLTQADVDAAAAARQAKIDEEERLHREAEAAIAVRAAEVQRLAEEAAAKASGG